MVKNIQDLIHDRTVNYKEAIVSILLGLPDGITYLFFGLLAGKNLAVIIGLHSGGVFFNLLHYFVGIGAAMGVAFFAINNVSREYGSIFKKKLSDDYKKNNPRFRLFLRCSCFVIAFFSAIPFAGMAMTAASQFSTLFFFILVISNALARMSMNDYALTHVLGSAYDRLYLFALRCSHRKNPSQARCYKTRQSYLRTLEHFLANLNNYTHAQLMTYRRQFYKNPLSLLDLNLADYSKNEAEKKTSIIISLLGFSAGALTATYLYQYAVVALVKMHLHSHVLVNALALCAIVPTCFLWGNETQITMNAAYRYVEKKCCQFFGRARRTGNPRFPIKHDVSVKVLLLLFFALAGAYSETLMVYRTFSFSTSGLYHRILLIVAPLALLPIYSVCVVELVDKLYSLISRKLYLGHVSTLRSELTYYCQNARQFICRISEDDLQRLIEGRAKKSPYGLGKLGQSWESGE